MHRHSHTHTHTLYTCTDSHTHTHSYLQCTRGLNDRVTKLHMPLLPGACGHRGGALFLRLLLISLGVKVGAQLRHREQRLIGGTQVGDDVGMFLLLMSHTRPTVSPFSFHWCSSIMPGYIYTLTLCHCTLILLWVFTCTTYKAKASAGAAVLVLLGFSSLTTGKLLVCNVQRPSCVCMCV